MTTTINPATHTLTVGQEYWFLVINNSIGGGSWPPCFPEKLRYDGKDENGKDIFSIREFSFSGNFYGHCSEQYKPYSTETFIPVQLIPDRLHVDRDITNLPYPNNRTQYWRNMLNIEAEIKEEVFDNIED